MTKTPALQIEDKHKAFMGFRKGCGQARSFIILRSVRMIDERTFEFEACHRFNHANYFQKIDRIYLNSDWRAATDHPYEAGAEAGENASKWFQEHHPPVVPFTEHKHNVDPDIRQWMKDVQQGEMR